MKKAIIPFLIAALVPTMVGAAEMSSTHDSAVSKEGAEQVSLTTYILATIAGVQNGNEQQVKLKSCVEKMSSFAPGGGDSTRQQRGYNASISTSRILSAALSNAASKNRAAATCAHAMGDLSIQFTNPNTSVELGRNGAPFNQGQYAEIQSIIGEKQVCALALSAIGNRVESTLAQRPPKTEGEAIASATEVIVDQMHIATRDAAIASQGILKPEYIVGDNGGSTRPYNPLTPRTVTATGDNVTVSGTQTSQLAQVNVGISAIAVGGIYTYTTRPVNGFVTSYDGKSFSVTKDGLTYYDATTLAGRQGTVTISGTGAYSASEHETGSEFRVAAIIETSECALAVNDVAQQLTKKFLAPRELPSPTSKFSQSALKATNIKLAFAKSKALIKDNKIEQDLDGRGASWRIGQYAFTMHDSGIKIIFAGQEFFDYNHISGRGYTVRATSSSTVSKGYISE